MYRTSLLHKFKVPKGWKKKFKEEPFNEILNVLYENLYQIDNILPPLNSVFNFLKHVNYEDVRVIMIGQDPYDVKGLANGLAFSVDKELELTQSLIKLYAEINRIYDKEPICKTLKYLRNDEGILLINSALTVVEGSNKNRNIEKHYEIWRPFIITLIEYLNKKNDIVFVFMGCEARNIMEDLRVLKRKENLYLSCPHPVARGSESFYKCNIFYDINKFFINRNLKEINWTGH
ncbi:hypothetical protein HDU92_007753 [Lobulomyces angularis]|nr:hypothetical protein HDU92_007753 [Lobulomyces angularis]